MPILGHHSYLCNKCRHDEEPSYEQDCLWWEVYCVEAAKQI